MNNHAGVHLLGDESKVKDENQDQQKEDRH